MKKLKLIVSDFHLGRGKRLPSGAFNTLEDFPHDHRFKELLEFYHEGIWDDAEVELIFNGDMINLIQVDYHGHYPAILTEDISVSKLQTVILGHPVFFKALCDFLKHPKATLTYIVGNHDQEMLWKKTRALFEEVVGKEINWRNIYYLTEGIHIEHGHQYETVNRVDPTQFFISEGLPEPILNLPWGTLFTIQYITKLKTIRPAVDKVRPFRMLLWWSLQHDFKMALASLFRLICYFSATRFRKNRYRKSNWRTTLKILREASVFPDLTDAAKKILRTPEIHTVIFGHTHVYKHVQITEGKQYLNLGTWTDIISLDIESFARRSKLTYVRVEFDDNGNHALPLLRHWIGRIPIEDDALAL